MKKRIALAAGVSFIAVGIILTAVWAQPPGSVLDPKIIAIVVFVLLGTVMQIYGTWPRRRNRYFTDAVWAERPALWQPATTEPKSDEKSIRPKQRRRKPNGHPAPAPESEVPASH